MRRNILLILTDQQRQESLGCTGRSICRTPSLDALAASGVRFDNAYSVCALCTPARASMLTGLYPHNHHLLKNNDWAQWTMRDLPGEVRPISRELVEAGYRCGYVGKWHCGIDRLPSDFGFVGMDVPGYGNCYETPEYAAYLKARGLQRPEVVRDLPVGGGGRLTGPVEACGPHFLADETIAMLREFQAEGDSAGEPFFLVLSFWGPHAPYSVPEPYASMYDPADVELWGSFRDDLAGKPTVHRTFRDRLSGSGPGLSEADWRRVIARYWGFCTFLDHEIGRVLDALRELHLADETAVLFASDHGDALGCHGGMFDKGPFMYEDTYRIPMILRVPEMTPAGAVSDRLVTNMDLAPTVLELAAVMVPFEYDGRSLIPLLENPRRPWPDDILCEFHGHRFFYTQRMLRWGRFKYVWNAPDIDELYDLQADPHELHNRIDDPAVADVLAECRSRLWQWLERSRDPMGPAVRDMILPPRDSG